MNTSSSKPMPDPAREIALARLRATVLRFKLLAAETEALGIELANKMITPQYAQELLDQLYSGAEEGSST